MSLHLHVTMLGQFSIWEGDAGGGAQSAIRLPATARSQSLLAYLLLHRRKTFSRDALAEMLWPGRPPQRARRSLSTALWRIRRCFAPIDPLKGDHQFVRLVFPGEVTVDVEVFEQAAKESDDALSWQGAVDLYAGELLPGFYDDWIVRQREWLRALYQETLLRLMVAHKAGGEPGRALEAALMALSLDACNEVAHRTAMWAYAMLGQRSAVRLQYQRCREALARELDAEPAPETVTQFRVAMAREKPCPDMAVPGSPLTTSRARLAASAFSPLVGRENELALLRARWLAAQQGHGSLVFLQGEAGIGKSRLLATLEDEVRRARGAVLSAVCYEHERNQPYGVLMDVLREAVDLAGAKLVQQLSSWQIASLARLAPELRQWLPADARYMIATALEQRQLLRAMTSLLSALARHTPLLLLMDDLQWASESTLAWLPFLAEVAPSLHLLWVGAYRIEEVAPDDLLARILREMQQKDRAETVPLSRLSVRDLAQWLPGLDETVVERIHHYTEGNPFFVLETVRSLAQQGRLRQVEGEYRIADNDFALPLPDSVRQAIEVRLAALAPPTREGLAVAAVIGRVFDLDVWTQAWGQGEETALKVLNELLPKHFLQEGEGAFARDFLFEHHLVRETVYQGIPKPRRQKLHLAVAAALESLRESEPNVSATIAFHYLRGARPQKAWPWLLQAGDQAVAVAATSEALRFYQRTLAGLPQDEAHRFQRAVLVRKIGETHFRRGDYDQAEAYLLWALDLLDKSFPATGLSLHWAASGAVVRQILHRFLPLESHGRGKRVPPALQEEVAIYTILGWIYSLQSRYEPYLLVSLRALNRSEGAGYARGVAVAATALGLAADFMAQFGLAGHFHHQAQAVVSQVARPADAGFVAFGRAYHAYLVGDEAAMLAQAALAADSYRQVGDAHRWSLAMALQAYVLVHRGRLEEAGSMGQELAQTGQMLEDAETHCVGELLLGLVGFWQGRWEEAGDHYRRAAMLAGRIPDFMSQVESLAGLARCQLRLARWEQADAALSQAGEVVIQQDVKGDSVGKFRVAACEAALWATERPPHTKTNWLARAKRTMIAAQKQAKTFRPIEPEVWRLCGRYEWLRERPDAAKKWWKKSMARAEALRHPLDWAVTALEMGLRLGDDEVRDAGRARLEELGALGEIRFLVPD